MCLAWLVLFVLTVLAFWKGKIFLAKEDDVIKDLQSETEYGLCLEKVGEAKDGGSGHGAASGMVQVPFNVHITTDCDGGRTREGDLEQGGMFITEERRSMTVMGEKH